MCAALKENRSLTDLNLSRNRFGAEGAELLVQAIDDAPALRSLDVRRWAPDVTTEAMELTAAACEEAVFVVCFALLCSL